MVYNQSMPEHEKHHNQPKHRGGTPPVRSIPPIEHVPGAELSPRSSAVLLAELADIRYAEIAAAGPGVVGGRPPEPISDELRAHLRGIAFDGTLRSVIDESVADSPELRVE